MRGQTGTYTLTVKNLGSAVATGPIQVHDTLPAGLTYVSAVGGGWACSHVGQTVSCSRSGDLAAGATLTITLTVTVETGAAASVINTVQAASQTTDPNWGNNTGTDTTATIGPLSIGPATPLANGAVGTAYSQALQASGGTPPYGWTVSAGALPGGLSLHPTNGTITGTPTTPGTFNFTARLADAASPTPAAVTRDFSITIASADLTLTKTHTGNFLVGTNATYVLTVANAAGVGSTTGAITVTDTLPSSLGFVSWSGTPWSCTANGQIVTCIHPGPLAPVRAAPLT